MSWKMTAEELLRRYANGERDFAGVDLHGVDLSRAILTGINLDRADLTNTNFSGADLSGDYQRSREAGNSSRQYSSAGKYSSKGLGNSLPKYTCIRHAVLRNAIFRDANVSYVDFARSDLTLAIFSKAICKQTVFCEANLYCIDLTDTNLHNVNFREANLEGTILEGKETEWT